MRTATNSIIYDPDSRLLRGHDKPLGYVPTYALVLGAPALGGAVAGFTLGRGRGAFYGALGGLAGGLVVALLGRAGYRLDF